MRELKFRAWDESNRKMLWHFLISSDDGLFIIMDPMLPTGDDFVSTDLIPVKETVVIEQYTGFKDKNGKEIYEGDIVEGLKTIGPVRFDERSAQFGFDFGSPAGGLYTMAYHYDVKVIGNIYENPDLLQGVKNAAT